MGKLKSAKMDKKLSADGEKLVTDDYLNNEIFNWDSPKFQRVSGLRPVKLGSNVSATGKVRRSYHGK